MKAGLVLCGPDVAYGPMTPLSGTFKRKGGKSG